MPSVYQGLARRSARQMTGGLEQTGEVSLTIDGILNPVLNVFGAADVSQLPAAVQSKYEEVKTALTAPLGTVSENQIASALGPALANAGLDLIEGNPQAAGMMIYQAMEGLMVMAGPLGAAVVGVLNAIPMILQAIGGTAQGGAGACGGGTGGPGCYSNGDVWYGAWNITKDDPPPVALLSNGKPDPRWVPWTNTTARGPMVAAHSDGSVVYCSDDLPTVNTPFPLSAVPSNVGIGAVNADPNSGQPSSCTGGVTAQFAWLPAVIFGYTQGPSYKFLNIGIPGPRTPGTADQPGPILPYPKDSFDYAVAHALTIVLEQYLNAHGPQPTLGYPPGPSGLNLRDMVQNMLAGWNVIHEPGNRILLNDPKRKIAVTQTFGGNTTTTQQFPASLILDRHNPGDLASYFLFNDSRTTDYPQAEAQWLNTGPLLQSIKDLFSMTPDSLHGPLIPSGWTAPSTTTPQTPRPQPGPITFHMPSGPARPVAPTTVKAPSKAAAKPPPPPPSWVGLGMLTGIGATLAFSQPWLALGVLAAGTVMAGIETWGKK